MTSDDELEVVPIGEEGYRRLTELLENPPVSDGDAPGELPRGDVPEDIADWLKAMKEPLVYMGVGTVRSAVTHRINGTDRGRLKELYKGMSPVQISAVMRDNTEKIRTFADQRAGEAALIASMRQKLTMAGTRWILGALAVV